MIIGEDIPALIPMAIVTVFIVITFTALFVSHLNETVEIQTHRTALSLAEKITENTTIPQATLEAGLPNFTTDYDEVFIKITDLDRNKEWGYGDPNKNYSTSVSLPLLIKNKSRTFTGKATVKVMQK